MSKSKFVGVDGCPYGWFSIGLDDSDGYEVQAFTTFRELLTHYREAKLVLVDIPIGLLEDGPGERACEPMARARLGPRRSSVFPVPPRVLVHKKVKKKMNYACTHELSKSIRCEKGISRQTYNIMGKIDEVDRIMTNRCREASPRIREVHPEVCFWALNGKKPMRHSKKDYRGIEERVEVLKCHQPLTEKICDSSCKYLWKQQAAGDDILDALAAAVTAKLGLGCPGNYRLQTLPECPPTDDRCLPMEMVYVVRT